MRDWTARSSEAVVIQKVQEFTERLRKAPHLDWIGTVTGLIMEDMSHRLAILGPGTLGQDLALFAAGRGWEVALAGRELSHARNAHRLISERISRIRRPELEEALRRILPVTLTSTAVMDANVLFEALPEQLELKQRAWQALAAIAPPDALLLTGTSSLPVREVGARLPDPTRLSAFHVFVPIHRSTVVEIVASPANLPRLRSLAQEWGLDAIAVEDTPGFAATRMGMAVGLEAMRLLEQGTDDPQGIDRLMVQGYGWPVGPLELSDRVGLDVRLAIARQLFVSTGKVQWEPPEILIAHVASGRLGRKSGQGFYRWNPGGNRL